MDEMADKWLERSKRFSAEGRAAKAELFAIKVALAAAQGQPTDIYSPDCDCPAYSVVRARKVGLPS
jgi:hypothetical protein